MDLFAEFTGRDTRHSIYWCCLFHRKRHAVQYIWQWLSVLSLVLLAMLKLGRDTRCSIYWCCCVSQEETHAAVYSVTITGTEGATNNVFLQVVLLSYLFIGA
eukprot:16479_1